MVEMKLFSSRRNGRGFYIAIDWVELVSKTAGISRRKRHKKWKENMCDTDRLASPERYLNNLIVRPSFGIRESGSLHHCAQRICNSYKK